MVFITVFEKLPENRGLDIGTKRCVGYFTLWKNAEDALHSNMGDIWEGFYNYAVIERIEPGIYSFPKERQFFKFDVEKKGFFEIEESEDIKHLCNFSIG